MSICMYVCTFILNVHMLTYADAQQAYFCLYLRVNAYAYKTTTITTTMSKAHIYVYLLTYACMFICVCKICMRIYMSAYDMRVDME